MAAAYGCVSGDVIRLAMSDTDALQERRPTDTCRTLHHLKAFDLLRSEAFDHLWFPRRSPCVYVLCVKSHRGHEDEGRYMCLEVRE